MRGPRRQDHRRSTSTWPTGPPSTPGPSSVVADHGQVNLIVNNAGVALGATVESMSYEDFEWLMNINFWGVVYGTKAFLPHLKASGEGHVVNLSSVFGLISVPVAVRLQRGEVRRPRLHRHAAHGARDRRRHRSR